MASLDDDGIRVTTTAGDPIEVEIARAVAVGHVRTGAELGKAVAEAVKAYREAMRPLRRPTRAADALGHGTYPAAPGTSDG